jgi:hypothetical protein
MKGRALEPSHPISTTICNIPRTQSEADEPEKHSKQKRDEKDKGIHEMLFQAPKQNSYTSFSYCFYAVDQNSKQHNNPNAPFHINTRFLSLSLPVKQPLTVTSSRCRRVNFH